MSVLKGRLHSRCPWSKGLLTTGTDGKLLLGEVFLQRMTRWETMCQVGQKEPFGGQDVG